MYPPLIFVDEDIQPGTKLAVAICGAQRSLRIISGDEHNTFEIATLNDTCSCLKLKKALDADVSYS